jgi:electron transport complex protein RnfG
MVRPAAVLAGFALLATTVLVFTYGRTREPIARAERAELARSLRTLIPVDAYDRDPVDDTVVLAPDGLLGSDERVTAFRARIGGETRIVAFNAVAPDGYNGAIRLLVAVRRDGHLAGVRVVNHHETPGLGDGIEAERSPWIHGFDGKSLGQPPVDQWKVKKDGGAFDQLTGATITPRAVVRAVRRALQYFASHRDQLIYDGNTNRIESGNRDNSHT